MNQMLLLSRALMLLPLQPALQGVSECWNGKISQRSLWLLLVGEPCCPLL